ncbi:MAG: hypothetical protein HY541_07995 [Deltaproteobacteria bacterium]|nr:hypothetical protein [Deltaproteobacteria bacterium]
MKTIKDMPEHSRPREILGLRVLDHVIVTRKGYTSFKEAGLLERL